MKDCSIDEKEPVDRLSTAAEYDEIENDCQYRRVVLVAHHLLAGVAKGL
jgi:hypothetical protein